MAVNIINECKVVIYKFRNNNFSFLRIAYCEIGYIMNVCKKNIYILGASAIITIEDNKSGKKYILLQKRTKSVTTYKEYYHIFGGSMKVQGGYKCIDNNFDESFYDNMKREISEETPFTHNEIEDTKNEYSKKPLFSYFEEDKMGFAGVIYHLHFSVNDIKDKIKKNVTYGNECCNDFVECDKIIEFMKHNNFVPMGKLAITQFIEKYKEDKVSI